ncbi:MAG: glycosyltransferase family 87 protein [Candidatus Limnocylindrales bacterium]
MTARLDAPTRRRAGVFRRAIRREASRLHDRRRLLAMAILILVGGTIGAGIIARGDPAGADARAYWAAVRIWLNGGDPYHPTGPFLPYVYAPWMLPLFTPWAILPWDVAWVVWRGSAILLLFWTVDWAYRRRPLATAAAILVLAFPIGANLDTGNITLYLAFMLWGAQFAGPRLGGLLWGLATWMKWVPAPYWIILAPRARSWGLIWLAAAGVLSIITLPLTILQLQALFGFGARPIRLDYLVLLWAVVPWWWRHPDPAWFLRPARWPALIAATREHLGGVAALWRADRTAAIGTIHRAGRLRIRAYLGLDRPSRPA